MLPCKGFRDWFFPVGDAEVLADMQPRARLKLIGDARTYVQLEQPQRLADLVTSRL